MEPQSDRPTSPDDLSPQEPHSFVEAPPVRDVVSRKGRVSSWFVDPWRPGEVVPLDRWAERQQFPPLLMAALVAFIGMFAFQILGTLYAFLFALLGGTLTTETLLNPEGLQLLLEENLFVMLLGNTAAQFSVLFALGWLAMRLHTSRPKPMLRFREGDAGLIGLSVLGLVVLVPLVTWIGEINNMLPVPPWLREMSDASAQVIERAVTEELSWVAGLLMLAVTPAICEEVFFRGYVQRHVERSMGVVGGIVVTGVFFGAFHLNPLQVVPLALLGVYMGYVVWRTGSLWAGIAAHFANNSIGVSVGKWAGSQTDPSAAALAEASMPWYVVLLSVGLSVLVIGALHRQGAQKLADRSGSAPPAEPPAYPEVTGNGL